MASNYTDPSDSFVWWVEGDKLAIATTTGDGGTTETGTGKYKAAIVGATASYQADGTTPNLLNESLDSSETTVTVDYGAAFSVNDILLVESEKMLITAISSNDLTVTRGYKSTTAASHDDNSSLSTTDVLSNGILISYYAEPDEVTAVTGSGSTVDLDNQLQPLLIDFVKAHLLFDAAAREKDPNQSAIRMQSGQVFLNNFKEGLIRYGSKKSDKTGGTRAILPFSFR